MRREGMTSTPGTELSATSETARGVSQTCQRDGRLLVHLASGIGNIVLATPLLVALERLGYAVDVLLNADYPQTGTLFEHWSAVRELHTSPQEVRWDAYQAVIPAIPPFYWAKLGRRYRRLANAVARPPDALFYENEQEYYLAFARRLGYRDSPMPSYRLPVGPSGKWGVTARTLVLCPGCKSGEMAAKRWPYYATVAAAFPDVVVVGTADDVNRLHGGPSRFPEHARMLIDKLTLSETAGLLASAGVVVANDSGLAHVAAAVGSPTIMLFGPTPEATLGRLPSHVQVLRAGLHCEPCWFSARFSACGRRVQCLRNLRPETIVARVRELVA